MVRPAATTMPTIPSIRTQPYPHDLPHVDIGLYLLQPHAYLIDPRVFEMSGKLAVCSALGVLVGGWLRYEALCRSPFKRHAGALFVAVGVWLTLAAWVATELFSGRAAFLLMGALMLTFGINWFVNGVWGEKKVAIAAQAE